MPPRPIVLDELPVEKPVPTAMTRHYPGIDVQTFIHARTKAETDGIPNHNGGCWASGNDNKKVRKRVQELTKGWEQPVFLRFTVVLEYAGMKVWARGEEDELWPVVRTRAEQILDTVVLTHRHLHPPEDQIARTHKEYEAGMRGTM
jgi:hypothetical protein